MIKIAFLALTLFSFVSFAAPEEPDSSMTWKGPCFDATSQSERDSAQYSARYYTFTLYGFEPSLDGTVVANWISGRSLVAVKRAVEANREICVYNFSGVSTEPKSMFRMQAEIRHLQGPYVSTGIDIVTSLVTSCNNSLDEDAYSQIDGMIQKNYRLVSSLPSHNENQCLYIFVQNFNSEKSQ